MTVESIDAQAVLQQMRSLAARAQGLPQGVEALGAEKTQSGGFSHLLTDALDAVNHTQKTAGKMTESFERGDPNVDLAEVMVAVQKANVSFQAALQVRNRLVSAYQDIMNMPI